MFYRIDYLLLLLSSGVILGLCLGGWASRQPATKLLRVYFICFGTLSALGLASEFMEVVQKGHLPRLLAAVADTSQVFWGSLLGLGLRQIRRPDANESLRTLLTSSSLVFFLSAVVGVSFVSTGLSKAFYVPEMTEFFAQSGYSATFLRFIIFAEVFGGVALCIPFTAPFVVPALSVLMFGAIATHLHNRDGANDDTGAVAMLVRLGFLAGFHLFREHAGTNLDPWRKACLWAGGMVACGALAVLGSEVMRSFASAA